MTTKKVSISVEAELLARVRAAAEAQIRPVYLQRAIDALDEEFGPMSDEEVAQIIAEARKSSIIINGNQFIRSDQGAE